MQRTKDAENTMQLKVKLTNRAILRSGEDNEGGSYEISLQISDLAYNVCTMVAERLHEDIFVCAGCVNEDGDAEPRLTEDRLPDLLCLDGTEVEHLVAALRQDHDEVQACRANMAAAE